MTDIDKWIMQAHGKKAQLIKLGEECSELAAAISKLTHLKASKLPATEAELKEAILDIHAEFGDVRNLMAQMVYVLRMDIVENIQAEKKQRTVEKLRKFFLKSKQ